MWQVILKKDKLKNIAIPRVIADNDNTITCIGMTQAELTSFYDANVLFEHKNSIWYLNSLECIGEKVSSEKLLH